MLCKFNLKKKQIIFISFTGHSFVYIILGICLQCFAVLENTPSWKKIKKTGQFPAVYVPNNTWKIQFNMTDDSIKSDRAVFFFIPLIFHPIFRAWDVKSRLHVFFDLPFFLCAWGFHSSAWREQELYTSLCFPSSMCGQSTSISLTLLYVSICRKRKVGCSNPSLDRQS